MFGLENVLKKVTDLLPGKDGAPKGKEEKTKESKGDTSTDSTEGIDKDKDKAKDAKDGKKDGKKDEAKKAEPPKEETYDDYLIACVRQHSVSPPDRSRSV